MKFMVIRKASAFTEAEDVPTPELIGAMDAYITEQAEAGVFLDGQGLKPSREGARVNFKDGEPTVIDGPFTETKELVAGYSLLECASLEEAVEWCKRWPKEDEDGNVELEIRPLYSDEEVEDWSKS